MIRNVRIAIVLLLLASAFTAAAQTMHWGEITPKDCVAGTGAREWSAILWNIPWGQSWESTCLATPASVNGAPLLRPNHCVTGTNVWGVWHMLDNNCGPAPRRAYEIVVHPPRRGTLSRGQVIIERNRNRDGRTFEILVRESLPNVLSGTPAAYRWQTELDPEQAAGHVIVRIWVRRPDGTEAGAGQAIHTLEPEYTAANGTRTFEFAIRERNDRLYEVTPRSGR